MTAPKLREITPCACCGVEFLPPNPRRRFCSHRCSEAARRGVPSAGPRLDAKPLRDFLRALDYTTARDLAADAGVPERMMCLIRSGERQFVTVDTADRLLLHTNVHISVLYPFKETAA